MKKRLKAKTKSALTAYSVVTYQHKDWCNKKVPEKVEAVQRQVKRRLKSKVKAEHTAYNIVNCFGKRQGQQEN